MKIMPVTSTKCTIEQHAWTPAIGSPLVKHEIAVCVPYQKEHSSGSSDQPVKIGCSSDAAKN